MKIKIIEAKLEEKELEHILLHNKELSENAKIIVTQLLTLVKMKASLNLENEKELQHYFEHLQSNEEMKRFFHQVFTEGVFKIPVYVD